MSLTELIEIYRKWNNSDVGTVVSFICLITGISVIKICSFSLVTIKKHKYRIVQFIVVAIIVALGFIVPIADLVLFSWKGFTRIVLHLLSMYAIFSFFGTFYIIKRVLSIVKESEVDV